MRRRERLAAGRKGKMETSESSGKTTMQEKGGGKSNGQLHETGQRNWKRQIRQSVDAICERQAGKTERKDMPYVCLLLEEMS